MYLVEKNSKIIGVSRTNRGFDARVYKLYKIQKIRSGICTKCGNVRFLYAKRLCKSCWVTIRRKKMETIKQIRCRICGKRISSISTSKTCSSCCRTGSKAPKWNGGSSLQYALKNHKKRNCNRCNSKSSLDLHHIDRNRSNNKPNNLETLCRSCHKLEHKDEVEHPIHRYGYKEKLKK